MADAIDESRLVVGLLVEQAVEIGVDLVDVFPIADVLLEVVEHIDHLDVGASMERALERSYACGDARIGVGAGRRGDAHGERGVVTSAMLRLDDEQQVEHARVELGVVFVLDHIEKVLGDGLPLQRMAYVEAASLHRVAVDVVGVGDDGGKLGDELYRLPHEVVARDVVGVGVVGVHLQHATRQNVHDVRPLEVDDVDGGAMVEQHIVVEQLAKRRQLLLVGQLA